jgi:hypothetical protein
LLEEEEEEKEKKVGKKKENKRKIEKEKTHIERRRGRLLTFFNDIFLFCVFGCLLNLSMKV